MQSVMQASEVKGNQSEHLMSGIEPPQNDREFALIFLELRQDVQVTFLFVSH